MENLEKDFSKIYDQFIGRIYRFIFLKVSSQEVAEDLTSETFLRGWKVFGNGEKVENPSALLYKIARNLIIDHYREKSKAQFVSIHNAPVIDVHQDLAEKAALSSDLEVIKHSLLGLKEDYQNVIIWRYLDDLPLGEVAKMLGRSEEATRVLLHRAIKSLKNNVKEV